MSVNCSQVPIAVRLAMSGDAPALSAVTIMLLAMARRLIVPLELLIRVNCSQVPIAVRLAMSGDAPALSAVTIMLLAWARKLIVPLELLMRSNCSQVPIAVRLAMSGDAPALSAVTIMLLAMARKLTTGVVLPVTTGGVGRVAVSAIWPLSMRPPSLGRGRRYSEKNAGPPWP